MFAGLLTSIGAKVGLAVLALSLFLSAFYYVRHLQSSLEIAKMNVQIMEDTLKSKDQLIESQRKSIEDIKKINIQIDGKWKQSEKDKAELQKKFKQNSAGKPRNLNSIAVKEPNLVQDKINRGTSFALRCNEIVTGSQLKPEDDKNTLCPELIKRRKAK